MSYRIAGKRQQRTLEILTTIPRMPIAFIPNLQICSYLGNLTSLPTRGRFHYSNLG